MMAANALKYSECMRSHGEPDFPEPNAARADQDHQPDRDHGPELAPVPDKPRRSAKARTTGTFDEQFTSSHGG